MDSGHDEAWQRVRGIVKNMVTIASDQEQLLEHPDCWRPSKPGTRAPSANVPLKVLQAFTTKVDARQQQVHTDEDSSGTESNAKPGTSSSPRSLANCHEDEPLSTDEASGEESEHSVSSSQWPASLVEGALPPDSSQEEIVPVSRNLKGREASLDNDDVLPSQKRQRPNPVSSGQSSPAGSIKTQEPEQDTKSSSISPDKAASTAVQLSYGDMVQIGKGSLSNASEGKHNVSLDEQQASDDALSRHSVTSLVSGKLLDRTQLASSSGVPASNKTGTPPQALLESHSPPLQHLKPIPDFPKIYPIHSSTQLCSTKDSDICSMPLQAAKGLSSTPQSPGEFKHSLIEHPKRGFPTIQVDRTPNQLSNMKVASSTHPIIPKVIQEEALPSLNARIQDPERSIEESELRAGLHSTLSARPFSRVKMKPARDRSCEEKPKKRLKIQGDFAFASTYDSPETINRASRQDRREFLASYAAPKAVIHSTDPRASSGVAEISLFDQFKQKYPMYGGDDKHFWNMCRRIEDLHSQDRSEHPSLWDDYIGRNQLEYREYLLMCAENAEDPLPFDRFYREEIAEPLYTSRVLTPKSLTEALSAQKGQTTATMPDKKSLQSASTNPGHDVTVGLTSMAVVRDGCSQKDSQRANQRDNERKSQKSRRSLPWQQGFSNTVYSSLALASDRRVTSVGLPQSHISPASKIKAFKQFGSPSLPQCAASVPSTANLSPLMETELDLHVGKDTGRSSPESTPMEPDAWWQDRYTPFKKFVRADLAIRSGKGNAFAKPTTNAAEEMGQGKRAREPQKWLDVLSWTL